MSSRILVALLVLFSLTAKVQASVWESLKNAFVSKEQAQPPVIKVLIVHKVDNAMLEVKGRYNIYDPHKNERLGTRFLGKSKLIQPLAGGLKWGEEFPGVYQIEIVPDEPSITTVINGIEYKGNTYVYDIAGKISIVNEVDIEDYLHSLLSLEFKEPLSEEALAAAVIAARTQAYQQSTLAKNPFWHVEATQAGYMGHAVTHRSKTLENAIDTTKYMVLSRTGPYEGVITPFPIVLASEGSSSIDNKKAVFSLSDAESQAQKGLNAAQILAKAFPQTTIELTHYPEVDTSKKLSEK